MVALTHSFVVRHHVMETSEGVSVDSELIKANKYQQKKLHQFNSIKPKVFFEEYGYLKR